MYPSTEVAVRDKGLIDVKVAGKNVEIEAGEVAW
ncbi:unnamed protein product, partial [Rotaria sp. Silwood1]